MSSATLISSILLFLGFSFLHDSPLHVSSRDIGFSAKIIHRDSHESPFHNPNSTTFSRNLAAIHGSAAHKNRHANSRILNSNFDNISIVVTGEKHEHMIMIEVGMPPRIMYALMDTASHLVWILCSPCKKCFKHVGRIFKPKASSTYVFHQCESEECSMLVHTPCHGNRPRCNYRYEYVDGSNVTGVLSTETLSFDVALGKGRGKIQVPRIVFGCTHETQGYFNHRTTGIVGLGAGGLSLVRQLGPHGGNKFSYCLPTRNRASRMYFGSAAVVSGPNAVSTPLYITEHPESFYKIELDKIHVTNDTRTTVIIPTSPRIPKEVSFLVDSGDPMSSISPKMMLVLSDVLESYIPNRRVDVPEKEAPYFDLCFDSEPTEEMPLISFEFMGGAIVALKTSSAFTYVNRNTICLAIASARHDGVSVFGSRAQSTTRMGFDLDALRLTFLSDDC